MTSGDGVRARWRGRIPYFYSAPLQIEGGGLSDGDTIEDGADVFLAVGKGTTSSSNNTNTMLALFRISDNEPGRV
jgi:hypothetical protein